MLAKIYLTAEELGLTEQHKDALHKVLDLFDEGLIKHVHSCHNMNTPEGERKDKYYVFNMNTWNEEYLPCGTVACIGGTAEIVGKCSFDEDFLIDRVESQLMSEENYDNIHSLFYPSVTQCAKVNKCYADITVEEAREALFNYLTTGKPNWEKVWGL